MKLARVGQIGHEKPAAIDTNGKLRDLSSIINDITPEVLAPARLGELAKIDLNSLPLIAEPVRYGAPIAHVPNLICIGLNYTDHAEETGAPIPSQPILFNKHTGSLCGADDDVILPEGSNKLDWEVELAFAIGRECWHVDEADALSYVAGYMVMNDISERRYQLEWEGQWTKGKSYPTFAPCGPWLVTNDEVSDPQDLHLWLKLNGETVQNGTTQRMIFGIKTLVSYLSRFMRLMPGDIVTTGTPPGVGLGMTPNKFMKLGDVMELGISGLGVQKQTLVSRG